MTTGEYNKTVKALSHRLFGYVYKSLGDEEDANDIVQDSFLKLWQNCEKVEFEKAKSWLFTTAYHGLVNFVKKKGRMTRMEDSHEVGFEPKHDFELKEIIEKALNKLPELHKSIILLRDMEGYNYKEIGEILDLSESQVKVYLFRARNKVKDDLKDLNKILP